MLAGGDDVAFNATMAPILMASAGRGDAPLRAPPRRGPAGATAGRQGRPGADRSGLGEPQLVGSLRGRGPTRPTTRPRRRRVRCARPRLRALGRQGPSRRSGRRGGAGGGPRRRRGTRRRAVRPATSAGRRPATCWRAGVATATTRPSSTSSSLTGSAGWPSSATTRARRCSTPSRHRCGPTADLDTALRAMADFADLKSPWFRGHSPGVAELAVAAARPPGMPRRRTRPWLGGPRSSTTSARSASPSGIWDHPGRLSAEQWERVRLHPYLSERVLRRCSAARPVRRPRRGPPRARRRLRLPPRHRRAADLATRGCSPPPTPTTR